MMNYELKKLRSYYKKEILEVEILNPNYNILFLPL